ncbi:MULTISPECIES: sensor histidine kinase [spotted fever group]|uniref:histidine kinase n=1 Tax=Rickettsia tamurae subsp. buchneri TaxID=1462938 RepID=A0A8E0WMV3_9RICK|nr:MULTISPECIES: ATP-binding protein [spotted fever group]EER22266.1 sensor protein GacS [Rickettsia endosymbiont of Ixodes scapularis]KDO03421.1 Signal transduction histidine-protein kinase BarA [Rickettsia tamurae subsp. buchneri]
MELQQAKNKLKEAELVKIDLIQNIGHSINIPCTGIFTRIVVLYEIEQNPEMKEYLATIMNCAKALLDYSNYVVDFLQANAGLTSTVLQPFDPKKLVEQSIAKATPAAQHKGLRLVPNIHYEMPDVIVGDNYRLQAILDQLISNSIQFTEQGTIVITVNLFPARSFEDANDFTDNTQAQDDRKRILQLMVHDTGIGIHQEKQQYICEEFVKFNSALQCKGLGLGLMFVKQLINEMHGEITLSSEEGKTTTVECKVPVKLPLIHGIIADI